jgi:hypothetical protein
MSDALTEANVTVLVFIVGMMAGVIITLFVINDRVPK